MGRRPAARLTSDESDVLAHQLLVHADKRHGQSIGQEFAFELDSLSDDLLDGVGVRATFPRRRRRCQRGAEDHVARARLTGG